MVDRRNQCRSLSDDFRRPDRSSCHRPTAEEVPMGHVLATITTSLDGYVAGPDDGPERGLGVGGERLHYWVMGGPWTYETEHDTGGMTGADKEFMDSLTSELGAGICGRGMYDAA